MTQLTPVSVAAPGFKGLNTQASIVDLDPAWALEALNCIIDRGGRIASRKGWLPVTLVPIATSPNVEQIGEYLKIDGTTQFISAANNIIYSGSTVLTNIYSTAITANKWQMVNFNNFLWLFQKSHAPLRWNGVTMQTILSLPSTGTPPQANAVCAAYGRLWVGDTVTDRTVLQYSDTLLGQNWTGGASGTIDLKSVWVGGMDSIVAIAAFNGFLIIFGMKSILVYQGPSAPSTMSLVEHIRGIGCVARDSVQDIGTDILFLSDTGIRSLARTIQEKSMPLRDISKNVRDDVVLSIMQEADLGDVRSAYHEPDRFYLVNFPSTRKTYCFDIGKVLDDGSSPVTTWSGINPRAILSSRDRSLYFGQPGVVARHTGYLDNASTYDLTYLTPWMSFGAPAIIKILKRILMTVSGSNNTTVVVKWSFDYNGTFFSQQQIISGFTVAEYGIAEFGIAEYTSGASIAQIATPGMSAGKMVQVGLLCTVNGAQLALQKFDVYAKPGKMA